MSDNDNNDGANGENPAFAAVARRVRQELAWWRRREVDPIEAAREERDLWSVPIGDD